MLIVVIAFGCIGVQNGSSFLVVTCQELRHKMHLHPHTPSIWASKSVCNYYFLNTPIGYQIFLIIFFQAMVLNLLQIKRWVSKEYHPWWYHETRFDLKLYPVLTSFLIPTKHLCEPTAFGNGSEAKYAPHIISSPIPDWYWYGAVILPQVIPEWYVLQYHYRSTFTHSNRN